MEGNDYQKVTYYSPWSVHDQFSIILNLNNYRKTLINPPPVQEPDDFFGGGIKLGFWSGSKKKFMWGGLCRGINQGFKVYINDKI